MNSITFKGLPLFLSSLFHEETPLQDRCVLWHTFVVAYEASATFNMLDPSAWVEIAIRLPIHAIPLVASECAKHEADVDEVKFMCEGPRLADVVYFENAVGWQPGFGWWVQVDTMYSYCRIVSELYKGRQGWQAGSVLPSGYWSATSIHHAPVPQPRSRMRFASALTGERKKTLYSWLSMVRCTIW